MKLWYIHYKRYISKIYTTSKNFNEQREVLFLFLFFFLFATLILSKSAMSYRSALKEKCVMKVLSLTATSLQ